MDNKTSKLCSIKKIVYHSFNDHINVMQTMLINDVKKAAIASKNRFI